MGRRARKGLARKVRVLRLLHNWTQEDLAEACGMHRTYVSLIERAQCNVCLDSLERLADAFDVSLVDLLAVSEGHADGKTRRRGP